MATTKLEIRQWLMDGIADGATHIVVVCDTFDHEDYPIYVYADDNVREVVDKHNRNMRRVMEVYDLSLDLEKQLNEKRAFHLGGVEETTEEGANDKAQVGSAIQEAGDEDGKAFVWDCAGD